MTKCLRSTIENVKQLLRNCRFGAIAARVLRTACWVLLTACSSHTDFNSWKMYGGNTQNNHYSSLSQIDTNNVAQLKVAWTYHTGDMDTANHSQIQCNPIIVDGVLYGTSPLMKLFAVDAATGKEKWQFNPFDSLSGDWKSFFILNNCMTSFKKPLFPITTKGSVPT